MKKKLHISLIFMLLVSAVTLNAQQATSEWRTAGSGDFANTGGTIWEKFVTGAWVLQAAAAKPSGSSNVTIRTGHTVTLSATTSILGLTIESGATLNATATSPSAITFRVGTSSSGDVANGYTNNVTVIQNNGTLGSTTGTGDGIALEMSPNCQTLTLQGTGTTKIARFRPQPANPNSPATFTVDQNMDLLINNNYAFTTTQNGASNVAGENMVININAGKTVKLYAGGYFHGGTTPTANPQGTTTYNISGTLDLSATTSGALISGAGSGLSSLNLNIKNGGVMKLGTTFSAYKGSTSLGSVNMTIESGGVVDGTALTSGITNNSSTLGTGYSWFVTQGTGVFRGTTSATAMTFPVGPTSTSYNPVVLTNGNGVYSVGVATGVTPSGLDATKAINRTWTVTPVTASGTVDINFGYNNADANASCTPSAVMTLAKYSSAWSSLGTGTPGANTAGTDMKVGYIGVGAFSTFVIGNAGTVIPVELMNFKAYAKNSTNILEWQTASERNNQGFDVERSVNGYDFEKIGTVKGVGSSAKIQSYNFTDFNAPLSIVAYYRLKQVDFDGISAFSKTLSVVRGKANEAKFYPSVSQGNITLDIPNDAVTSVTISDLAGKTVFSKTGITGSTQLTVNHLATGTYLLTIEQAGFRTTGKFIKL